MSIKCFRALAYLLLGWIIFRHKYVLIGYWLVLYAVVEFLCSRKKYEHERNHIALIFFCYLLFITIIRTTYYILPKWIVYIINAFEHIFFSFAVSYMLILFGGLMEKFNQLKITIQLLITVLLFNVIGVLNEVYQCLAKSKPAFAFINDFGSLVDLGVNVFGSVLFSVCFVLLRRNASSRLL